MERIVGYGDFRIVSISLLDLLFDPQQTKERYIEENFYNMWYGQPDTAIVDRTVSYYFNFPISGALISPEILPEALLKRAKKYYKYLAYDPSSL